MAADQGYETEENNGSAAVPSSHIVCIGLQFTGFVFEIYIFYFFVLCPPKALSDIKYTYTQANMYRDVIYI